MAGIDFKGQTAIVTGAGGGTGREMTLLLGRLGANVVVKDYGGDPFGTGGTRDRAEAVAAEIRSAGGRAIADTTMVGSVEGAAHIRDVALHSFGRIDAPINNAGVVALGEIDDIADDDLERFIEDAR